MGYPTQQQKVDYLFKKIGFSASKTGVAEDQTSGFSGDTKKAPPNEAIPSPLVVPASSLWADSSYIPATPPTSSNGYVGVYSTATAYRMTVDTSVSNNRAFVARSTWSNHSSAINGDWIDTQFGADYLIKVYKGNPASGTPGVAYTNITAAGTGGGPDDTWFFDYSSGVLNFNGADLDGQLVGIHTDNVYIVGYRYLGTKGVQPAAGIGTFHNLYVSGISTFAGNAYANSDLLIAENIVHTGDTNTKITFPSAGDQIAFETAGAERLSIDSNGKSTFTGTQELTLPSGSNKGITLNQANNSGTHFIADAARTSGGTVILAIRSKWSSAEVGKILLSTSGSTSSKGGSITFHTADAGGSVAERLRIASDGKVGIAQASPDYALDVTGDIGFTSQMRGASGSASAPAYSFDGDSDSGMWRGGVNILSFATAGTERLNITAAGKVGIGTISSSNVTAQLHIVEPTEGNSVIQLNSGDGYPGVNRNLTIKSGTGGWAGAKWIFDAVSSGGQLEFQTTSIKRLHILQSGYVGIGSGTPSAWLDVNANSAATIQLKNTGTVNSMLMYIGSSTNSIYSRGVNSSTARDFTFLQGNTEKLRIRASGDIHIVNNVNVVGVSTFNANVHLLDDDRLRIGGSAGTFDGLELYHDGSHSYINDSGTGDLKINGSGIEILSAADSVRIGSVLAYETQIFHSNSLKLASKVWGINVTGTLDTDQLVVSGISTFTGNIDANGDLDVSGTLNVVGLTTFNEDVKFIGATSGRDLTWDHSINRLHIADNASLAFGDGNDLIINHTGSHSFIQDAGSGNLNILSDSLYLQNTSGTEKYIVALNNAQVDLYHNNVIRLTTTGTGVEISDDLNVAGVSTFVGETNIGTGGTVFTALVGATPAVGIGSATPDYMLDVAGAINSETDIKVQGVSVSETALNDAVAMAIALG